MPEPILLVVQRARGPRLTSPDPRIETFAVPSTSALILPEPAIETLADWQAHTVSIDYFFLGYLKDKSGSAKELHHFEVPAFLIDGAPRLLNIAVVGRGPGLEDDFILRSIEASGFDLRLDRKSVV